ncbi:MAG: hypothetical protein E7A62_07255 [Actinomycetaceae bacterium]|nr:hypothetical protein [Actinomycetaceae bacterium]MDU0970776.1 hypothetical protein [Actinomycetaceae bacterium]
MPARFGIHHGPSEHVKRSAALIWGYTVLRPGLDIHVMRQTTATGHLTTIGESGSTHPPSTVIRHRLTSPEGAVTRHDGLAVLNPEYVMVELLSHPDPLTAIVGAESAIAQYLTPSPWDRQRTEREWATLKERLLEISEMHPSRRYKARVRKRLDIIGPHSQSPAERLAVCRLWQGGVRDLTQQLPWPADNPRFFLDFGNREKGVAIEVDGRLKYGGASGATALYREKVREDALRFDFPHFIRVGWDDLWSPHSVAALRRRIPQALLSERPLRKLP